MRISITHQTAYTFDKPVPFGLQELRLSPVQSVGQRVLRWQMALEGGTSEVEFVDQFGNQSHLISITPGAQRVAVRCEGDVETTDTGGVAHHVGNFAPLWLFLEPTPLTTPGPAVSALVKNFGSDMSASTIIPRLHELSATIATDVAYEIGHTSATSTAEDVLVGGRGVCQDHAHVFLAAARQVGVPARYVSGYLLMEDRVEQDATHAWAEAWIEGLGWVGFDVSNGISPDERYVRIAVGLDYKDAAPIAGIRFGDAMENLHVELQVQQQ